MKEMSILAKAAILILCFLSFITTSISESYSAGKISTDEKNIAIKGYDTVAYFTEGVQSRGLASTHINGRKLIGISQRNRIVIYLLRHQLNLHLNSEATVLRVGVKVWLLGLILHSGPLLMANSS